LPGVITIIILGRSVVSGGVYGIIVCIQMVTITVAHNNIQSFIATTSQLILAAYSVHFVAFNFTAECGEVQRRGEGRRDRKISAKNKNLSTK
jgi:hypothetical protein